MADEEYKYPEFSGGGDMDEFPPVTHYSVKEKEVEDLKKRLKSVEREKDEIERKFHPPAPSTPEAAPRPPTGSEPGFFGRVKNKAVSVIGNYEGFMRPEEKAKITEYKNRAVSGVSNIASRYEGITRPEKDYTTPESNELKKKLVEIGIIREQLPKKIKNKSHYKSILNEFRPAADALKRLNGHVPGESYNDEIQLNLQHGYQNRAIDDIFNPTTSKIKSKIVGFEKFLATNPATGKFQEILNNKSAERMIIDGGDVNSVIRFRELEKKYDNAKFSGDFTHANKLKLQMVRERGIINGQIAARERTERVADRDERIRELKEQKLLKDIYGISPKTGSKTSKYSKEEGQMDYRNQMKKVRGVGYYPSSGSVSLTNSVGFAKPNVSVPSFAGYAPTQMRRDYEMSFAKNRIENKRIRELNRIEMERLENARRDAELKAQFTGVERFKSMIRGAGTGAYVPEAKPHNLPSAIPPKNKNVSPIAKVSQIDIAIPKVNMSLTRRVPLSNKPQGGMKVSPKNNQINIASRIAGGIEGMVSPMQQRAATHKDRMYHSPECAIANICHNTKTTAAVHKDYAMSYKKGKSSVKNPDIYKTFSVKNPMINLEAFGIGKKKKGKK